MEFGSVLPMNFCWSEGLYDVIFGICVSLTNLRVSVHPLEMKIGKIINSFVIDLLPLVMKSAISSKGLRRSIVKDEKGVSTFSSVEFVKPHFFLLL